MSIGLVIAIILVVIILGGVAPWGSYPGRYHGYGMGPWLPSGLGVVLVIILILFLLGRI